MGFAIHQHESATGVHVFPILNPPPTSVPIPSLWVIPVYQPQASCILHQTWTGDSFLIWYYICFNAILPNHPPPPSPTESVVFIVQLSHPYMTTGKTIALTRRTFVGKVISLLFNMLSQLVIAFLPRSKRILISWLQSPSAVILQPPKIKSLTVSIVSPSICCEVMGPDAMIQTLTDHYYMPDFRKHYHLHFPHLRSLVQNVYPQAFDKEEWQLTQLSWPFRFLLRTFQVAQGLKIHLPRQETWVWLLVQEDPTCRRATKPMYHNYWSCALEPTSLNYCTQSWACTQQQKKHCNMRVAPAHCN